MRKGEGMKKRNLLSPIIAVSIMAGVNHAYRPYLDTRVGTIVDLLL